MTLKEQKDAKVAELKALKEQIENGDAEAIKSGEEISKAIETLNESIEKAEKAGKLLAQIGNSGEPENGGEDMNDAAQAKSLGEHFTKSIGEHGRRFQISATDYKAATDPMTSPAGAVDFATTFDRNVVTAPRKALVIRDLFGAEQISGSTLVYLVEGALEGAPAVTAEGNEKPQVHFGDPTPKTVSLSKIACHIKESDEYINDYPFLASAINGRLLYELGLVEQNSLVTGLVGTSGIQTGDLAAGNDDTFTADMILKAIMDVQEQSGFAADAIVMSPANWYKLRVAKNDSGNYYGGGFFGAQNIPNLWGTPVCVTTAVTDKQILVGAFKTCGSVVSNGGVRVEAANTNEDDFTKNLMTIRAEERLALAIRRPAGFKLITEYTYTKGSTGDKALANTTYYTQSGSAGAYVYTAIPDSEITVGTTDVSGFYTRA